MLILWLTLRARSIVVKTDFLFKISRIVPYETCDAHLWKSVKMRENNICDVCFNCAQRRITRHVLWVANFGLGGGANGPLCSLR